MATNETSVTFKVFNQDFNRAMSEMNSEAKKLRQELKLEQEQLKFTGTESEKLTSVVGSLQKQYDLAKQKTQETAAQLELVKKQFGDTSTEAAQMETKVRSAQIAEQQLANSLSQSIKQLESLKQAESGVISEEEKFKQSIQQLQLEQTRLKSTSQLLSSEYDLQKAKMGANASEADKLVAAENHVEKQTAITKQVIANLERQLALTEQQYGKNSTEANQMAIKLNAAKASVSNLGNELEKIKSGGNNAADGIDQLGKKISAGNFMQAAEILSGVADKVVELGKAAIQSARDMADSQQSLQNNLGLTKQEAEGLQTVVRTVFEQGVTESVDTASKAVQNVKMHMGDLNNTDLTNITNKVIAIGKHTDTDVNENVRAASQLMTNFGVDAGSSLDLIAAGFQNGLNRSGDFLDTINEYSPQFAQAGFSAKDMLNIINDGMKSGAFNTDKAADAVKEFGLKLKDGTIEKNLNKFSQGTQDLFQKFQNGKATSAQVFQSISNDISNTSNQQDKYNLGVAAFGTQYEDLGNKAVDAFAKTGHAIDDVNGKADQMSQRSPGETWQQTLRELQDSLLPIGNDLMNALTPIIFVINMIAQGFSSLPQPVRLFIEIGGGLIVLLTILAPIIAAVAVSFFVLDASLLPIIIIIGILALLITGAILAIQNWGAITTWLQQQWTNFSTWASPFFSALWLGIQFIFGNAWNGIQNIVQGGINIILGIINFFSSLFTGDFQGMWDAAHQIFSGALDFIFGLFQVSFLGNIFGVVTSFINQTGGQFSGFLTTARNTFDQIGKFMQDPVGYATNFIRDHINDIVGFFNSMHLNFPDIKLPQLPHFRLTGSFSLNPPSVPELNVDWYKYGGFFDQASIIGIGEAGPEAALPLTGSRMDPFADAVANRLLSTLPQITESKLIQNYVSKQQMNFTIISQLDGREVARNQYQYIDGMLGGEADMSALLKGDKGL